MSFPTEPCFVLECNGYPEELLQHPAMKFMEGFENSFHSGTMYTEAEPFGTWHTTDFEYTDTFDICTTGKEGYLKLYEVYQNLFEEFFHCPRVVLIRTTSDGYECYGKADLYATYKVPGEKKETSPDGKEWHFKAPGAWRMVFRRDGSSQPEGLKLSAMAITSNPLPILGGAVARKMIPPEFLQQHAF
ncbi:hypothetical protein TWF694_001330 [Orbilia ellipsospora]|uniref:Uncharacterized protein n=1 Tax=Orbilia ellipsospora TaxID=2528407 RepID=A0AAV9XT56_9PEZI